jgi:hypothetical protein
LLSYRLIVQENSIFGFGLSFSYFLLVYNQIMDWMAIFVSAMSGLFGAILGSVITGYFTYKTAKMNLVHEDEMKAKEERGPCHET